VDIEYLRVSVDFKNIRKYFLSKYPTNKQKDNGEIFFWRIKLQIDSIRDRPDRCHPCAHSNITLIVQFKLVWFPYSISSTLRILLYSIVAITIV